MAEIPVKYMEYELRVSKALLVCAACGGDLSKQVGSFTSWGIGTFYHEECDPIMPMITAELASLSGGR